VPPTTQSIQISPYQQRCPAAHGRQRMQDSGNATQLRVGHITFRQTLHWRRSNRQISHR
jgi:hypothetical protein